MYLANTDSRYMERFILIIAGGFILESVTLSVLFSPYWLILTALVGLNHVIFALTGFCIKANLIQRELNHSLRILETVLLRIKRTKAIVLFE